MERMRITVSSKKTDQNQKKCSSLKNDSYGKKNCNNIMTVRNTIFYF